jgi:site-specific DNA-cytosine methylase
LAKAGFTPGTNFRARFGHSSITLEVAHDGNLRTSGRRRDGRPIIELNASEIERCFPGVQRVAVRITQYQISIAPSRIAHAKANRFLTPYAVAGFAGGGLLSQAAKEAGFETVAANEVSDRYAEIYEANHNGHMMNCCVSDAHLEEIASRYQIGLFHAGIPCEFVSTARRNAGNERVDSTLVPEAHHLGDMTFWALRAVDILNPHTVLFECAPRFLETGAGWIARRTLERMGYTVDARVVSAAELGGVTRRPRAVLAASSFDSVAWPDLSTQPMRRLADFLLHPDDSRCEWFTRRTRSKSWLFKHWAKQTAKGSGLKSAFIRYTDETVGVIKKRYLSGQGDNPVVVHPTDESRFRWLTLDEITAIMGVPASYDLGTSKIIGGEVCGQGVEVNAFARLIRSITRNEVGSEATAQAC